MAQTKENNPAPRAKAPAAPKAAAANGTVPAGEKHTRPTTRRPYYNRRPRRAQQPKEAATPIHIYPLGGLGEVGKNMTVYECNGDMIIVDCGLVFPDSEMFGVDMVIPDFTFVVQNKDKIKGLLITHGHEDHIGSIPYLLQKFSLPVYGTRLTCGLIKNKLEEFGLAGKTKFVEIVPRQKIKLGCFTVEPIHVNHSIPDAVAFAIDSPAGTIIQTGDFKIDYTPLACGVTDLSTLSEYGQRGVLALLSDSTNAERPGFTATEQKVAAGVRSLFARARNKRIIIATFASNIYRVQQIIDLAVEDGRKVAFSGRSMVNNTAMAQELGYMHIPEGTLISVDELNQYPPEQVVLVTTGSQGEPLSALSRMASCSHRQVRVGPGDFIIISANPIPGNEKSVTKIVNGLLLLGAEVIYESMYDVHVSGHACQEEQKLMLTLTKPKYFLPVHGEYKQLKKHALTAASLGIPTSNILIAENGSNVILSQDEMKLGEPVTAGAVMVDGLGVGDVGNVVLRDRKHLSDISIHGVLVDVYGEGVLITGESGIGKSEAALELIKRGHRLVSDDVVELRKVSDVTLVGSAPDITRHFIELRGIGIVDVKALFGVLSVRETQNIDLVITLEEWNKNKEYDRLGLEEEYTEFLGNKVVCHHLPIRPGRNLAIIVETAAVNHRQKQMGYNAAQELYKRVQQNLTKK